MLPPVPRPFLRPLLLTLGLALVPGLLPAGEPYPAVPAPAPAKDAAKPAPAPAPEPVLVLPTIEVRQSRIKELDTAIRKLDKLIAREEKKVKANELDKALNNPGLTHAAAIFGGNNSDHLSAIAASRVALLEAERDILEAMKRPSTLAGLDALEKELDQIRTTRRNLDNVDR